MKEMRDIKQLVVKQGLEGEQESKSKGPWGQSRATDGGASSGYNISLRLRKILVR